MKIEIGESLLQSYLKNVKECILTQTNWKTAASWKTEKSNFEKAEYLFNRIQNHNDFSDVFKKSSLEQALKQAELDVVGANNEKLYMIEVAFHENGLQYGGRLETKDRVCKKLLRAYLIGLAYFPNYKYEVIFASPKVNPATDETIRDYFSVLNKDFSDDEKVEFKYIANDDFEKEILVPTIQATLADSDSSELFLRSVKMLELFNMVKLNSSPTKRSFGSTPADLTTQRQNYSYMQLPSFGSKDATQFMVNGSPAGGKGPTVYAAVKYYVNRIPAFLLENCKMHSRTIWQDPDLERWFAGGKKLHQMNGLEAALTSIRFFFLTEHALLFLRNGSLTTCKALL